MMFRTCATIAAMMTAPQAQAEATRYPARLAGHAVLPAGTLLPAPEDAPQALQTSGKFTERGNPARLTAEPTDGARLPLKGQPVQGFSGISAIGDGRYHVLADNGFGSKANSPDAMLAFHVLEPDFRTGEIRREDTIFLSDPDKVIPFVITMEGSETRYLTGADLDLESFQVIDDEIVIGDEFGPYVIVADAATGEIREFHETFLGDGKVLSPDHYTLVLPNPGGELPAYNARRSRGFEGLAVSTDGTRLYPLLEGPIWRTEAEDWERTEDGRVALRLLEMDAASRDWTGRSWLYPLEAEDHAIGDFNMIDETRGLVIERDGGEGDAELACEEGETEGCFGEPATFKRVYLIDMDGAVTGAPVDKVAYIDLLDIEDPNGIARQGQRDDGRFTFPFVTIENVDRVDDIHIIVGNDSNFPFSSGRAPGVRDDSELVLLEAGAFLEARAGD